MRGSLITPSILFESKSICVHSYHTSSIQESVFNSEAIFVSYCGSYANHRATVMYIAQL